MAMTEEARLRENGSNERRGIGEVARALEERFPGSVSEEGEGVLTVAEGPVIGILRFMRVDSRLRFDLLVDMTAVDRSRLERWIWGGQRRFALVYHLYSTSRRQRLRLEVALDGGRREPESAVGIWPVADWLECEVFDMFGIRFGGHPGLRRLFTADLVHWPLRKDYPLQGLGEREQVLRGGGRDTGNGDRAEVWPEIDSLEAGEEEAKIAVLHMGPQHPAGRGGLRFSLAVEGDRVLRGRADPGWVHAGFEKLGEYRTYLQMVPVTERLSPLSPFGSSLAFVLAAELLLGLEIPRRGQHIRVALNELARIGSHLAGLAEQARATGAHAASMRAADQRERLGELTAWLTGTRAGDGFLQVGGVREDLPEDGVERATRFFAGLGPALDEFRALADSRVWIERTRGLGSISAEAALAWGLSGPALRSAGVARDVRRDEPYSAYGDFDFEVVVGSAGDACDRYRVRLEEVAQSCRIIEQALGRLPDGPSAIADGKVVPPAREQVHTQAEGLIHHFALWMDGHGLQPPAGAQAYVPTEGPEGELGFLLISDGTDKPYRLRARTPSFAHYQYFPRLLEGMALADVDSVLASLNVSPEEVDR